MARACWRSRKRGVVVSLSGATKVKSHFCEDTDVSRGLWQSRSTKSWSNCSSSAGDCHVDSPTAILLAKMLLIFGASSWTRTPCLFNIRCLARKRYYIGAATCILKPATHFGPYKFSVNHFNLQNHPLPPPPHRPHTSGSQSFHPAR
jgi:hypothetical protein